MKQGVQFLEEMKGWLSFDEQDFNQSKWRGRVNGTSAKLRLTIKIRDLDCFLANRDELAAAEGWFECDELGGRFAVETGSFQLFAREPDSRHLRMRYRLFLRDQVGRALTLIGFKLVEDDPNYDSWRDTNTLFARVFKGHRDEGDEPEQELVATGILGLGTVAFLRELASFRGQGGSRLDRARAVGRFNRFFLRELVRAYREDPVTDSLPSFPRDRPARADALIPWHEVPGHPGLELEVVPYRSLDGMDLNLHHLRRGPIPEGAQPVMLSHGAGVRAQLFYGQPSGTSLAERLLEKGYDVWVQNWRGSIDFPGRGYTHDRVARCDHPPAVYEVLKRSGASTLKAIVHCQGSINFTAAAVSGLLPEVTHVVSSAVSLHIRVTPESRIKQLVMLPVAAAVLPGYDAQWGIRSPSIPANFFAGVAGLVRRDDDCRNPVCATANYMYGAGPDVLLRHAQVDRDVHDWLGRELGYATFGFVNQLVKSVGAGALVPAELLPGMPRSYVAQAPDTEARFTFIAGSENRMFLPEGQKLTFAHFATHAPERHRLHIFEGLGHLDTIIGRRSPEVFEAMLAGLER